MTFNFYLKNWLVQLKISAHTEGGPRSRVCAWETLRSAPHWSERKFSVTRVCKVAFKHLQKRAVILFGQKTVNWGVSEYFCELGGHARFQITSCCISGLSQQPQAAHALHSDKFLKNIFTLHLVPLAKGPQTISSTSLAILICNKRTWWMFNDVTK